MAGWNADTAAGPLGAGTVTLVEGSSFCISLPNGDISADHPHGLFVQDARILSGWNLTVDGQALEPLAAETKEPYRALFVGRVPRSDGYADSPLIVERLREVGAGIQEQVTVRNYSPEPADCEIALKIGADFADLFEVKEARIQRRWDETRQADGAALTIRAAWQDIRKGVVVQAPGAEVSPDAVRYRASVPAHGHWSTVLTVLPSTGGTDSATAFVHAEGDGLSPRDRRRREWVAKIPVLQMGNRSVERTLRRSLDTVSKEKKKPAKVEMAKPAAKAKGGNGKKRKTA